MCGASCRWFFLLISPAVGNIPPATDRALPIGEPAAANVLAKVEAASDLAPKPEAAIVPKSPPMPRPRLLAVTVH